MQPQRRCQWRLAAGGKRRAAPRMRTQRSLWAAAHRGRVHSSRSLSRSVRGVVQCTASFACPDHLLVLLMFMLRRARDAAPLASQLLRPRLIGGLASAGAAGQALERD